MKSAATEKAILCGHEISKNSANSKWKKTYHQFGNVRLLPQRNNPTPICKRDIDVFADLSKKKEKNVKMYDNTNKYFKRLYLLYGTMNEMRLECHTLIYLRGKCFFHSLF